jgi:hypothetical protein
VPVRRPGLLAVAMLAMLPIAACAGTPARSSEGARHERTVLVSGRDDHGLVATTGVTLHESVQGRSLPGQVPDGTLAAVVNQRGTWLQVRTLEGPSLTGWVDDFYLRGTLRLLGPRPACTVAVAGALEAAGEPVTVLAVRDLLVRVLVDRDHREGWVTRSQVRELPPQHEDGCAVPTEAHSGGHHH